jgi:hypothetical protein
LVELLRAFFHDTPKEDSPLDLNAILIPQILRVDNVHLLDNILLKKMLRALIEENCME